MIAENNPVNRYSRQVVLPEIGKVGQAKLCSGSVIIIGCGALGCTIADLLVRAGVGTVKIIDRDFVEFHNLQRQTLFDENDASQRLPKAIAAKTHLEKINSLVKIEGIIADVNFSNVERFCSGANVILDGLDNLETRYLLNDVSLKLNIPYIYGGAISHIGCTMTVQPHKSACLRCIFPMLSPQENNPTCETEGVFGSTPVVIGALEAIEAIKILVGSTRVNAELVTIDLWEMTIERSPVLRISGCPACAGKYEFLDNRMEIIISTLCGQQRAIQIVNIKIECIDLYNFSKYLEDHGILKVGHNAHMLWFHADGHLITVFSDGRGIIGNTFDEAAAEQLYHKYVDNYICTC